MMTFLLTLVSLQVKAALLNACKVIIGRTWPASVFFVLVMRLEILEWQETTTG